VPRDLEPEVSALDDVFLYTVDDLAQVVSEGLGNRQEAAVSAELIVNSRVEHFMQWLKQREAVPTIKALRDQVDAVRKAELEKALKLLQKGESPERALEALSHALTNKFLHGPSHALNNSQGDAHSHMEHLVKQLFQIKE
jgi:glutamyl-tRNA reductase